MILGLGALVLGVLYLKEVRNNSELKSQMKNISEIVKDTTISKKPYEIPKPYSQVWYPTTITKYKDRPKTEHDTIYVRKDSIVLMNISTGSKMIINPVYLEAYSSNPKLIGINLKQTKLKLDLLSTDGYLSRSEYDIDTEMNNYIWEDKKLTRKHKILKLQPDISYNYRVLNKLHDINLNLNIKTGKINYVLGTGIFYYPKWQDAYGFDFNLGIKYQF